MQVFLYKTIESKETSLRNKDTIDALDSLQSSSSDISTRLSSPICQHPKFYIVKVTKDDDFNEKIKKMTNSKG